MEEIKNSKGEPIGVQISIFDLSGMKEKEEPKTEVGIDMGKGESESVNIRFELEVEPVKAAVDELMAVIMKHNLNACCDDEGNIIINLGDLVTDYIKMK